MSFPRYPEYKDSGVEWLGEVPAHWSVDRLKRSITSCRNGIWGNEAQGDETDIPCVRVADFDRTALTVVLSEPTIRSVTEKERANRSLIKGNLLLEKSGGGENQHVGCVVLYNDHQPAVCSNFVARMEIAPGMNPSFWRYVHAAAYSVRLTAGSINQTSGIQNLDQDRYFDERAVFPSTAEQEAIATFLDRETAKIDALVAEQEKLIALLKEKRQAVISHAVTKGLNPAAPMKDSGIEWLGDVPAHWEVTRLAKICSEINDINHVMPAAVESGVPFLSAKDLLDDGTLNFTKDIKMISEEDFEVLSRKICPRRGDIIYSRIGACLGKARLVETDQRFLISYSCCVVRVVEARASSRFIRHLLDGEMILTEARMRTQGIGVPDLGLGEIGRFPVPLPPTQEQGEIADFLDAQALMFDRLTVEALKAVELFKEHRSALISAAVTGKIDVRGIAAERQAA